MLRKCPARILIVRLSHIGDVVLTLPMLCRLREALPSAMIAWAVEPAAAKLLRLHGALNHVIEIPRGWAKRPSNWFRLRSQLRTFQPEVTLDPQSLLKSSLLARLSGAKRRLGFDGPHGRERSQWFNNERVEPESNHLVDRSLELLTALGIEPRGAQFNLPTCPLASLRMDEWLRAVGVNDFFLINPGASWPSKLWVSDRFADVARIVDERFGFPAVVVWSGLKEKEMGATIAGNSEGSAIIAPETSLTDLAALAARATLFVGCDTGPLHIASAMGCRCVGLYGPTRPQDSGAYGLQHVAIQKWHQSGSNSERRSAANLAMRDISVNDVVQGVELCLAGKTSTRTRCAA